MRISDWSSDVCSSDLDAYFFVGGYPTGAVSELATSSGISLVPITGAGADKLLADYGFFAKDVVPEGTYAGVGETQPISVAAQWVTKIGSASCRDRVCQYV